MRRSAAPSKLSVKRPRFNPPSKQSNKADVIDIDVCKDISEDSSRERSLKDVLTLIKSNEEISGPCNRFKSPVSHRLVKCITQSNTVLENSVNHAEVSQKDKNEQSIVNSLEENKGLSKCHNRIDTTVSSTHELKHRPRLKPFKTPSMKVDIINKEKYCQPSTKEHKIGGHLVDDADPRSVYFSVVWCKLSKKKHKKWEGDAVMVTRGRSVTLLDLEGKEIGKGTGYKSSELQALGEGNTLVIGGKEIEIMGLLSEEDFKTGKCFNAGFAKEEEHPTRNLLLSAKSTPFVRPTKESTNNRDIISVVPDVKARHDPTAPRALVLPRPTGKHQWEYNKSNLPMIDVVVDPYLSQHLRPHQREGIVFIYQCIMGIKNYSGQGAILADEMGLGKTLQCICLIWTLLKQGPYGGKPMAKKVLVVTPGSLVKNWLKEFKKWLGTERLKVFAVTQDSKIQEFASLPHFPVCIISYEMLVRTIETIRQINFDLIVCDEGHRLKNSNIKTTSFISSLPCRRRLILTGTPIQNDLQELFSIVDFCNPGILGTIAAFRRVYEEPILMSRQPNANMEIQLLGEDRASELNRITSMFILRRTSDINNKYLPPKVELVLFCKPSPLQLCLYSQLINSRALRSCVGSHDTGQHLMCISSLKKLCNHPSLVYENAVKAENNEEDKELYSDLLKHYSESFDPKQPLPEDGGKLKVVTEILASFYANHPKERVVLVSNYTQTLDVLERLCSTHGYRFLRLDGQTPTDKRQQMVEAFNNNYGQQFVFLLSCKAGGVGLNLIGASRLILYDIDWNPANDLQAMARVWRDGQKKPVYIYRLLTTGTIEEKMYQRQVSKQGLSGVVVDARSSSTKQCFSPGELRDLFTLQENTLCATHDLLGCENCENDSKSTKTQQTNSWQLQRTHSQIKNLCMDELMEWKHIKGPCVDLTNVDPVINNRENGTLTDVTFAFWNKSNKQEILCDDLQV